MRSSVDLSRYEGLDEELPFDSCDGKGGYVLLSPTGEALRVSPSAYKLLRALHAGASLSSLDRVLRIGRGETRAQLKGACEEVLKKLEDFQCRPSRGRLPWGFWVRWPLISQDIVIRIASLASILYHPVLALFFTSAIVAGAWNVVRDGLSLGAAQSNILSGYFLFLGSLVIHEFGHAAACARYGAKPSDIGFTLYLVYPAFYSNVNSCWKLNRWKRVVVDLGGSYFQLIFGAVLLLAFQVSHWAPLRSAFLMIFYMCLFSLNPIFKFDGYWVLADALGVPNLSSQPWLITRNFGRRLLGRAVDRLPWSFPTVLILTVYTLASNVIWAVFVFRICPTLIANLQQLYWLTKRMLREVFAGSLPSGKEFYGIAVSVYFSVILCVVLYRLGLLATNVLRKSWKKSNEIIPTT